MADPGELRRVSNEAAFRQHIRDMRRAAQEHTAQRERDGRVLGEATVTAAGVLRNAQSNLGRMAATGATTGRLKVADAVPGGYADPGTREQVDANHRAAEMVAQSLTEQGFDAQATYTEEQREGYGMMGGGGAYSYRVGIHEVEVSWGDARG